MRCVFGGWFYAPSLSEPPKPHPVKSQQVCFLPICSRLPGFSLPCLFSLHVLLLGAQVCRPPSLCGRMISHQQLTVPWKSNHPAELDVCLFVLVDTDVHTAVLTVSHAHKKSHHYDGRGWGGYSFYSYGAVQLAVCSPSVCFISHTRRVSFTLYTHFTLTHTPIKARRHGHTDGSTSAKPNS